MRLLSIIFLVALSTDLKAGESIPNELFNSIQSLSQIKQILEQANEQCIENSPTLSAEDALETNPNYFGGITPKSAKWIEIVEIHREYAMRSCKYFSPSEIAESYTRTMLSEYTLAEAKELEKFLLSGMGKKMTKQSLKANAHIQSALSEKLGSYGVELNKWYLRRIQEVVSRPAQPSGG